VNRVGVGGCQNLIRGKRADWQDARYCGYPTIDLGLDRLICQTCHAGSLAFRDRLIREFIAGMDRPAARAWLSMTDAIIADMDRDISARLRIGAPLAEVYAYRADRDKRQDVADHVRAAFPDRAPHGPALFRTRRVS
jgi:hypothetical protein